MSLIMMNETPYGGAPSDPTKADLTSIAPAFDATAAYAEGDVVTYNGKVYTFTDEHTGDWDDADVDETDVAELTEEMSAAEVQAVKDAFDATALQTGAFASTFDIIDLRGIERIVGKLIESDGTEKVIYQKTITGTWSFSSSSGTNYNYYLSISPLLSFTPDRILEAKGHCLDSGRKYCVPLTIDPRSGNWMIRSWDYSGLEAITLKYTKTTT